MLRKGKGHKRAKRPMPTNPFHSDGAMTRGAAKQKKRRAAEPFLPSTGRETAQRRKMVTLSLIRLPTMRARGLWMPWNCVNFAVYIFLGIGCVYYIRITEAFVSLKKLGITDLIVWDKLGKWCLHLRFVSYHLLFVKNKEIICFDYVFLN